MPRPLYALYQAPPIGIDWIPVAINDNGLVVGWYWSPITGTEHTVVWDGSLPTTLPYSDFLPYALNNRDQIVGACPSLGPDEIHSKSVLYANGNAQLTDLGAKVGVGIPNHAVAINNSGLIAGNNGFPTGDFLTSHTKAFLYNFTADTAVGVFDPPRGYVGIEAVAINNKDSGHLVGNLNPPSKDVHMFICRDRKTIENLGKGVVRAINNNDVLACITLNSRAFRLDVTATIPIPGGVGGPDWVSTVFDINDEGAVVFSQSLPNQGGFVDFPQNHPYAGFWNLKDCLTTRDWHIIYPRSINNKGQIVGIGYARNAPDKPSVVLLDPVTLIPNYDTKAYKALLEFVTILGGAPFGGSGTGLTYGFHGIPIPPRQDYIAFWQRLPRSAKEALVVGAIQKLASLIDDPRKREDLQKATVELLKSNQGVE
jgi:hypothetical protein